MKMSRKHVEITDVYSEVVNLSPLALSQVRGGDLIEQAWELTGRIAYASSNGSQRPQVGMNAWLGRPVSEWDN